MELLLLRFLVWVVVPLLLVAVVIGPSRSWQIVRRLWSWIDERRHEPTEVLNRVVKEHKRNLEALRDVLAQAEAAQAEILRNTRRSEENINALEREARTLAAANDDLGAKAALYKLNLERLAVHGFQQQLQQQKIRIDQTRRRLHLLELRLRQYEVGRTILLSQLAEARTVEQQYALASQFDPFSAVASWIRTEGSVQQASQSARPAEQVYSDAADLPLTGDSICIDPETLDAQLAHLKSQLRRGTNERKASS
jgi:phage shock protein A